jgi:HlyD family secretion protein
MASALQQDDVTSAVERETKALRRRLAVGVAVAAAVGVTVFGWGAVAQLSGAVIAVGSVVVDSNSKKVQHPQGGVVSDLRVRDGDRVEGGEVLLRLDETQIRATLGVVTAHLIELRGRKARLEAERDNADTVVFPRTLAPGDPAAERVIAGEARLFQARRALIEGQRAQLVERIRQSREEIRHSRIQVDAKNKEIDYLREELERVGDLKARNLLPVTRVLTLKREETRIAGENAALEAQIARLQGQIAEAELQILALEQGRMTDAQKDLREIEARIAELEERRVAADDQLSRVDVRAPIRGVVHGLAVHTVGGVVAAGEQIMLIVPEGDMLTVEVRVAAAEIDQIGVDRESSLRFPAFNQRTTPEVSGRVTRISPDAVQDSRTGQYYYTARIAPGSDLAEKLGRQALKPGMPVEAFIATDKRSALSYIVKPLTDQFMRAFRER